MKIYVASPIDGLTPDERDDLHRRIQKWLDSEYPSAEIYFPLAIVNDYIDEVESGDLDEIYKQIAKCHVDNLRKSDVLVAFNPNNSRGSHFELGYAFAITRYYKPCMEIRIVDLDDHGEPSLMLAALDLDVEE